MYFLLNGPLSLLITNRLFVTPFADRFQYAYHKNNFPLCDSGYSWPILSFVITLKKVRSKKPKL